MSDGMSSSGMTGDGEGGGEGRERDDGRDERDDGPQAAKWTENFQEMGEADMIPLMGIRVLIGVDRDGNQEFFARMDGAQDNVMACFMLDLASDRIRQVARATFTGTARYVDNKGAGG